MEQTIQHSRLTRKQAAAYLGVTPGTLAMWASSKRYNLPYIKIGHKIQYRREDLDAFLQAQTVKS